MVRADGLSTAAVAASSGSGGSAAAGGLAPARVGVEGRSILKLVLLVLGLTAVVAGYLYGPTLWDRFRHPSSSVAGTHRSELLGMELTFPSGWRHLDKDDVKRAMSSSEMAGGRKLDAVQLSMVGTGELRAAMFFRGGRAANPGTLLMVGKLSLTSSLMIHYMVQDFMATANAAAQSMGPSVVKEVSNARLVMAPCQPSQVPQAGAARCAGTAEVGGDHREVILHVWMTQQGFALALLMKKGTDAEAARLELEALLATLRPL